MIKILWHFLVFLFLTITTQLGGVAWVISLFFKPRLIIFPIIYIVMTVAAMSVAPQFGRTALSCVTTGPLQVQSWLYCATNRNYVTPVLANVLEVAAAEVERQYPNTRTQTLDAGFPFLTGFPLLPHLSHDDGRKADIALYYRDASGYLRNETRSPIGYLAYEQGATECQNEALGLRWDLNWLQGIWPDYQVDDDRTRALVNALVADARVDQIFIEPHLSASLGLSDDKIRFQGCDAARHDDHIHVQLK